MVSKLLKSALVAVGLSLGALASTTTGAQAGSSLFIETPGFSFGIVDGQPVHYDRRHRRGHRHDGYRPRHRDFRPRYYHEEGFRPHRCAPRRALRKARRNGLNRAHIVRVNPRRIVVAGRRWGERVVVGFGRGPRCPVHFVRAR